MSLRCFVLRAAFFAALTCAVSTAATARDFVLIQSTTSTQNSGLYDHLSPRLTAATGIVARVVAVGTGQAINNARNCDGDVLLVHATAAEEAFVAAGGGVARYDLMYNDFVVVGPAADPAGLAGLSGAATATEALARIAAARAAFVSRGDDSGTHKAEMRLWTQAGLDPTRDSGRWYREVGAGMGATLNIAVGMGAYALTDRATWIAFGNKGRHGIAFEGDPALFNQYGVILVNPERCPNVNAADGQAVVDWLLSPEGQTAINGYRRDGQQLFFANASESASSDVSGDISGDVSGNVSGDASGDASGEASENAPH